MTALVGWSLFHSVWQGLLIAGLSCFFRCRTRGNDSQPAYQVYLGVMAALGLLPVMNGLILWRLPISGVTELIPGTLLATEMRMAPDAGRLAARFPLLVAAWAIAAAALAIGHAAGLLRLHRIAASRCTPPDWLRRLSDDAGRRAGLEGPAEIGLTTHIDRPVVIGWLRPVILFPAGALVRLSRRQVGAALLHEQLHVKLRDPLVLRLQMIARTLLFFNPAIWWIDHRLDREREQRCDEHVLRLEGNRLEYARTLLALESARAVPWPVSLGFSDGPLVARVRRILKPGPCASALPSRAPRLRLAGVAASALVTTLIVAGLAPLHAYARIPWLPAPMRQWQPLVEESARRHGIDPDLLTIVALVESAGRPDAISPSGALGLMQLLPSTACAIARKSRGPGCTPDLLLDPALNVDMGAFHLAEQIADFGATGSPAETVALVAAAYNGGTRLVRRHVAQQRGLPARVQDYSNLVTGLWLERHQPTSVTYETCCRPPDPLPPRGASGDV